MEKEKAQQTLVYLTDSKKNKYTNKKNQLYAGFFVYINLVSRSISIY